MKGAWRRINWVPEAGGRQARRALVEGAQVDVEDAVC